LRRAIVEGARWVWLGLPLTTHVRNMIRHRLFRNFPKVFGRMKGYREWQLLNPPVSDRPTGQVAEAVADSAQRIIVVSHDAQAHGGQFLALGMVKSLVQELRFGVEVVLLLGGGRLKSDFEALAPVHQLNEFDSSVSDMKKLAQSLARCGFTRAIVNTTAAGNIVPVFSDAGIDCICLVHELPGVIRSHHLERQAGQIAASAKAVVFPAQAVADGFAQFARVDSARQIIRPQGLYRNNKWRTRKEAARAALGERLGLAPGTKIVLAVGYADHRKGVDLFVACALEILTRRTDVDFIWVGHWDPAMHNAVETMLRDSPCKARIHFVGYEPDTAIYHAGADIFALTSREDPFPNVVLESFDAGVPIVAFSGTGGAASLVEQVGGLAVPAQDVAAFSAAISRLLDEPGLAATLGNAAQEHVDRHFAFRAYLVELCRLLGITQLRDQKSRAE